MRFSIIIPARNEELMIGGCLQNLSCLDFPKEEFEVILADNGSTDRTIEIFSSWSDRLRLSVVEKPGVNISAMRNVGVAISSGAILGFLDADCMVPSNWLKDAENFLKVCPGIVGAHVRIPRNSTWIARCWFDDEHRNQPGETSYIPSGNLLISRSAFDNIGGFKESLKTNEDYEICQRAKRAGYTVQSCPALEVIHLRTPQTISEFYKKQKWHGSDVFRVFLEHLPRLYNGKVVFFALYILLGLSLVLCGAVAVAIGGMPMLFWAPVVFTLCGPGFLAGRAASRRRNAKIFAPLTLLYFLYGVARAFCILDWLIAGSIGRRSTLGNAVGVEKIKFRSPGNATPKLNSPADKSVSE